MFLDVLVLIVSSGLISCFICVLSHILQCILLVVDVLVVSVSERERKLEDSAQFLLQEDISAALVYMVMLHLLVTPAGDVMFFVSCLLKNIR